MTWRPLVAGIGAGQARAMGFLLVLLATVVVLVLAERLRPPEANTPPHAESPLDRDGARAAEELRFRRQTLR